MKKCEWCNLTEEEKRWQLLESKYWTVYLADEQDYVGRCILVCNRHCGSMSDLNLSEWIELKAIIDKFEQCYKVLLGVELCNWSCLMNSFYKEEDSNPHLHIHVRPRYKEPLSINGHLYADNEYGHHYALQKENSVVVEDKHYLFKLMKDALM